MQTLILYSFAKLFRDSGVTTPASVQETTGFGTLCYDLGDMLVCKGWTQWSWKSSPALVILRNKKGTLFPETRYC